ncbi:MAG TPA: TIGR03936 family radical SAM-associated protein [Syntrophomonadaceae bacterium]|mgnify:CR=1 FL=1|nr:TIGR03936 family radical SAM-associated protein [Syntrophomonadaceae bacterium]HQE22892.1 TIGR03936 family radical SAM-associated protein [Syntrophomonadaceae bacterium]
MRIRAEYSIGPELRFLSNLETMHMMERALRRAGIPFALTEGFNPHIRLSMGTVLPVGLWGKKEYFDLELEQAMPLDQLCNNLNKALPAGVHIEQVRQIDAAAPSLMKVVNCAAYGFLIRMPEEDISTVCQNILKADSLPVRSRGKKKGVDKDLRKGIYKLDLQHSEGCFCLMLWVGTGEPVNIRYDEVMDLLQQQGVPPEAILDVFREGNYIRVNERLYSPLER